MCVGLGTARNDRDDGRAHSSDMDVQLDWHASRASGQGGWWPCLSKGWTSNIVVVPCVWLFAHADRTTSTQESQSECCLFRCDQGVALSTAAVTLGRVVWCGVTSPGCLETGQFQFPTNRTKGTCPASFPSLPLFELTLALFSYARGGRALCAG